MASYRQAVLARDAVFDAVAEMLNMRPGAVGVIPLGRQDYGIKVTLPRRPTEALPAEVHGMPVRYDVSVGTPGLVGGTAMDWHGKALKRRG